MPTGWEPAHRRKPRANLGSFLVFAWASFVAVYVFFLGGTYVGTSVPWARILTWVGGASVLCGWLVLALRRPLLRPEGPLPLAIIVAAVAFGVSSIGSARPRLSFEPTLIGLGTALLFLMLLGLLRAPGARHRAGTFVIIVAAAVALGYLGQVVVEWVNWWLLIGRISQPPLRPNWAGLTFGSPNLVATVLLLLAPLAVALAWDRVGRLPAAGLAGAALIAIFCTGSRGGYIGLGAEIVVGLGLVAARLGTGRHAGRTSGDPGRPPGDPPPGVEGIGRRPEPMGRPPGEIDLPFARIASLVARRHRLLGAGLLVATVTAVVAGPALVARFAAGGAEDRFAFWRTALATFLDHPLTGSGPGTWAQLRYGYLEPSDPTYAVPHAHNLYLQTLAELGLVGSTTLGLVVAIFLRVWWRSWRRPLGKVTASLDGQATTAQAGAALAGLAGLAGQSLVDHLLNLPAISLAVALLVGWVAAGDGEGRDAVPIPGEATTTDEAATEGPWLARLTRRLSDGRAATAGSVALVAILLAAGPSLVRVELAAIDAEVGNTAADRGDWASALAHYEAALARDPDHTLYQLQRGVALAHLGRYREARDAYTRVVPIDLLPENTIALATLHWQLGETEAALATAKEALRRGARSALVALNAGRIFEVAGWLGEATEAYAAALADAPTLARSSFWRAPERRVDLAGLAVRARDLALLRRPDDHERAALILAYAGLAREATAETDEIDDPATRTFARLAVAAIGGDRAAVAEIRSRALRDPLDFDAVTMSARLAGTAGDPEATRFRRWAAVIRNDEAEAAYEWSTVSASAAERVFGTVANYPFAIYQRRPSLDLLPPTVLVIGVARGG